MNTPKSTKFELQSKLRYWAKAAIMRQSALSQMYQRGQQQLDSDWPELAKDTQEYCNKYRQQLQFAMDSIEHYETLLKA